MAKMWAGRFQKDLNKDVSEFNSSLSFDFRLYKEDIAGSIAHANMLANQGIITPDDSKKIVSALTVILENITNGSLEFNADAEDIHMFIEEELTKMIGDTGKKIHTARSRNDQVALDMKMYVKKEIKNIKILLINLINVLIEKAEINLKTIMPGYTHLQRAQPVTFAHYLLAYIAMFERDLDRLDTTYARLNYSPLGACALAGTTYNIDRHMTAKTLGFNAPTINSLDSVSDRDYCCDIAYDIALIMMHLSRFAEEIILWCSSEYKFIELDDAYATGSSIMPQKKNPDVAELVRGKTGRAYGNLITLLTMLKGLPLAYNKDMQEDKQALFDSIDTVKMCLDVFAPMFKTITVNEKAMYEAAGKGFINATDVADYLTKKGIPFRDSYKITGELVARCLKENKTLEKLPIKIYQEYSKLFDNDLYQAISLKVVTFNRTSFGGPAVNSVKQQLKDIKKKLGEKYV